MIIRKLCLAFALCCVAVSAPVMSRGQNPFDIKPGTDVITRDEYQAQTTRHDCAKDKFTPVQGTIKKMFNAYYELIGVAYDKHNRKDFDTNVRLMGKVISDLGINC